MWPLKRKSPVADEAFEIVTERLVLRPAQESDYPQWRDVRDQNYAYLKPFEPTWPKNCLERDFFQRRVERLNADWHEDRCYAFLILSREGMLLGGMNINNITRGAGQFATLGYWIEQQSQGKGYMREAGHGILNFAFRNIMLQRINAACLVRNERSRNLLLSLGFEEEGFARSYIQIDGKRQDHILFGLNADTYSGASRIT
jgi:ribosomal-protein-alanine N-acetyltransferase